jgi:hypothetical protein
VGANLEKTAAGTNLGTSSDEPGVVNGTKNTRAGGLVGMAYNGTIKESYAKGKVRASAATSSDSGYIAAGGLVGVTGYPSSDSNASKTRGLTIEDSYSISPLVKSEGYLAYSGGIAGKLIVSTSTHIAKNAIVSQTLSISAGGTAVTKYARNIHTYASSPSNLTVNNNYHSGAITLTPTPGTANPSMDGASAALNNLADFTNAATLGWSSAVWQWDSVKDRPVLINNPEQ